MIARHERILLPGLLGVFVDVLDDALEQGVLEPLLDGPGAPRFFLGRGLGALALERFGEVDEPLGGVGTAVEEHVLDQLLAAAGRCPRTPRAGRR